MLKEEKRRGKVAGWLEGSGGREGEERMRERYVIICRGREKEEELRKFREMKN